MLGLRLKILLGFGGLIAILFAVGLLGNLVFRSYAATNRRVLQDDLNSVTAAQNLQIGLQAMEQLNTRLRDGDHVDQSELDSAGSSFETALRAQNQSITSPAERDATSRLEQLWSTYREISRNRGQGDATYRQQLAPTAQQIRSTIDDIFRMNAEDIRVAHGEATALSRTSGWFMLALSLCGSAGAIVFAVVIGRIIQRDHERLVRTQHTTQLAIDSLPDAVLVINPHNRVELANGTAKRLLAVDGGADLARFDWLRKLHESVLSTGRPQQGQSYSAALRSEFDGQARSFLPSAVPILDERQRPVGTTIVLNDVTHLRRLDEMKDNLLSLVSHELKNPLTSMRLVIPLLLEERVDALSADQRELLDVVRSDADRLYKIVENLLDLGRIAAGKAVMELRPVDPTELVKQAVERITRAMHDRRVEIDVQLPASVPSVLADPTRIGHVFFNLLDNARRYSRDDGRITLAVRVLDDAVEFSISDQGIGVPRQYLPRIFEKFFRVPGQSGETGSGLGLAIVKDIVEAHEGSISVQSDENVGTTFRFTLRRADVMPLDHAAKEVAHV